MKYTFLFFIGIFMSINSAFAQSETILFVMSSADTLELNNGKKLRQTGIFLNEFYMAYHALQQAGYSVEFATPDAKKISIDEESLKDKYWEDNLDIKEKAVAFIVESANFNNPISLKNALSKQGEYAGLIVPGGQGIMVDLIFDAHIPLLLQSFAMEEKAIGLICHAPSLITTMSASENPFVGFTVNSVSPIEEIFIEKVIMHGKPANRKIAKQLKELGLDYVNAKPRANFAIKDKFLVTSQNPFSGQAFNELFLQLLSEQALLSQN